MAKVYSLIIFFLLFISGPFIAQAATLSVSPTSGSLTTGENFSVRVVVASDTPFNAISGLVSFPTSIFSVESTSKGNSVLSFWVTEPVVSKSAGTVKFEGVVLGGSTSSTGTVITINLRAVKVGSGSVSFRSGQILANDGQGTDITGNLNGATFSVKEAVPVTITPKPESIPAPIPAPVQVVPAITQPAPSLKAPEIMLGTKYGAEAILGTSSYPNAQTLLTFTAGNGTKVFILGLADVDGSFNVLIPNSLKRGDYTVSATMIKEDKTNSEASNTIVVKVGDIFSDLGWEIEVLIALLAASIIYLILRIHFHFEKGSEAGRDIKNELRKTESILHKSFDILREDVNDYDSETTTRMEHKRMSGIKKDINDAERIIDKKIKDLES